MYAANLALASAWGFKKKTSDPSLRNRLGTSKGGAQMNRKSRLHGCALMLAVALPAPAIAAGCYGGEGGALESIVRKEEAIRLSTELNSKIMNALDKVMLSTDGSKANPPDVKTEYCKRSPSTENRS
jgi:hypothetical protein